MGLETITHSLIGKEDLKTTSGKFEVELADGRKVMMTPVEPLGWLDEIYTKATLPSAGNVGRLTSLTDDVRGLWRDTGFQWDSVAGEIINARDFGAVGDGVTDDSSALNDALGVLADKGGGTLFLPPGYTYKINTTLTILSNGVTIKGGGFATILKPASGVTAITIGDDSAEYVGWVVADLKVDGSSGNTGGVLLKAVQNGVIHRCWFASCGSPSIGSVHVIDTVSRSGNVLIQHNRFNEIPSSGSGIRLVSSFNPLAPFRILDNQFVQASADSNGYGVLFARNGSAIDIRGNQFRFLMTAIEITLNSGYVSMDSNVTQNSNAAANEGEFNCPGNCSVTGNRFIGSASSPYAVRVHTNSHAVIMGNSSQNHGTGFLYLDGVTDIFVTGNNTTETMITKNGTVARVTFIQADELSTHGEITLEEIPTPSLSAAGEGTIYFDDTAKIFKVSENGGAFSDLVTPKVDQATQVNIEGETNEDTYVPPDLIKHNPGVVKAFINFDGTGTVAIKASLNISLLTDIGGAGHYELAFTTNFSSVNYVFIGNAGDQADTTGGTNNGVVPGGKIPAVGTVRLFTQDADTGTATDYDAVTVAILGDQ